MQAWSIMYHDVVENGDFASSGFPGEGAHVYKLRREDFELHLEAIRAAPGQDRVSTIARRRELNGAPPVFLTFDDVASFFSPSRYWQFRWRGHFSSRIASGEPGFLGETQLRLHREARHRQPFLSHPHAWRRSPTELDREWREAWRLAGILGRRVASVPGGFYSRQVGAAAAAAGIGAVHLEPTATVGG
jgi:hypothetical protein